MQATLFTLLDFVPITIKDRTYLYLGVFQETTTKIDLSNKIIDIVTFGTAKWGFYVPSNSEGPIPFSNFQYFIQIPKTTGIHYGLDRYKLHYVTLKDIVSVLYRI